MSGGKPARGTVRQHRVDLLLGMRDSKAAARAALSGDFNKPGPMSLVPRTAVALLRMTIAVWKRVYNHSRFERDLATLPAPRCRHRWSARDHAGIGGGDLGAELWAGRQARRSAGSRRHALWKPRRRRWLSAVHDRHRRTWGSAIDMKSRRRFEKEKAASRSKDAALFLSLSDS